MENRIIQRAVAELFRKTYHNCCYRIAKSVGGKRHAFRIETECCVCVAAVQCFVSVATVQCVSVAAVQCCVSVAAVQCCVSVAAVQC
jgi:hypothetical protein